MGFLKQQRMEAAYRELLGSESGATSVTSVTPTASSSTSGCRERRHADRGRDRRDPVRLKQPRSCPARRWSLAAFQRPVDLAVNQFAQPLADRLREIGGLPDVLVDALQNSRRRHVAIQQRLNLVTDHREEVALLHHTAAHQDSRRLIRFLGVRLLAQQEVRGSGGIERDRTVLGIEGRIGSHTKALNRYSLEDTVDGYALRSLTGLETVLPVSSRRMWSRVMATASCSPSWPKRRKNESFLLRN